MILPAARCPPTRPVDRTESGFTLLEMIVVILVLGLMAGLVIAHGPARSPTLDLHVAASEVVQGLRGARGQAIATGRPIMFHMDDRAHAFVIGDAMPHPLPASLAWSVVGVADQAADRRSAGISFAPDGSSSGGTIDLIARADRSRVAVDWLTGRVTVANLPADAK